MQAGYFLHIAYVLYKGHVWNAMDLNHPTDMVSILCPTFLCMLGLYRTASLSGRRVIRRCGVSTKQKNVKDAVSHKRTLSGCFLGHWADEPVSGRKSLWRMASATSNLRLPSQPHNTANALGSVPWPVLTFRATEVRGNRRRPAEWTKINSEPRKELDEGKVNSLLFLNGTLL